MRSGLITRSDRNFLRLSLTIVVLGFAVAAFLAWLLHRSLTVDYSAKPSVQVFRHALNQAPPNGISELRVAGHGVLMGHMVWMRFSATDKALSNLLKSPTLRFGDPQDHLPHSLKELAAQDADASSIGWDDALRLKGGECREFSSATGNSGWFGHIVIDRKRQDVFIAANLL